MKSVSEQSKQKLPEQKCGESCVSTLGCLPPELGNDSRSESTDKTTLSDWGDGSGSLFVDDGCQMRTRSCVPANLCR